MTLLIIIMVMTDKTMIGMGMMIAMNIYFDNSDGYACDKQW